MVTGRAGGALPDVVAPAADSEAIRSKKDYIIRRSRNLDRDLLPYGKPNGRDVLIFGSGLGTEALWAMRHGAKSITGIDLSPASDQPLRLAMAELGLDGPECRLLQESIAETALREQRFDLIVSNGVFEHVMDLKGVFYSFRRLLRPGGRIAIFADGLWFSSIGGHTGLEGNEPWAHLLHDAAYLHETLSPQRWRAYSDSLNHMTASDFLEALRTVGLVILQLRLARDPNLAQLPEVIARVRDHMTVSATDMSVVSIGCELCFPEHIGAGDEGPALGKSGGTSMHSIATESRLDVTARHWSAPQAGPPRTRWWQSQLIVSHINRNYCGKPVRGTEGGDIELLSHLGGGRRFERALSVGCGSAFHEIALLKADVVGSFTLFEISPDRVAQARRRAAAAGVESRIEIRMTDGLATPATGDFELIYWKDALHHMFDVRAAVDWSVDMLAPGGLFFANEFVGPSLMQYTDRQLDLAERARAALPDRYLADPRRPGVMVPLRRVRPDPRLMATIDPSECADSSSIIPAISSRLENATVTPTGGIVYSLALSDILANFDETRDEALLRAMLLADDLCTASGETLYAVIHGGKPGAVTAERHRQTFDPAEA
jgi:SAM-dependent methyltransferase